MKVWIACWRSPPGFQSAGIARSACVAGVGLTAGVEMSNRAEASLSIHSS